MKENKGSIDNVSIITVLVFIITLLLLIQKNYFVFYKSKAIILILIITSFLAFLTIEVIIVPFIIAGFLYGFLEVVDRVLWKYPFFSWMFTTENFSGTYEGTQENRIMKEFKNDINDGKVYKEYVEHLRLKLVIHQTGSDIKANFFYFDADKNKSTKSESAAVTISKTADDQHYILTCLYGDIGVLENGGHHETIVLKYIESGVETLLEGGYYDNRKIQARGKFIDLKKVSSDQIHPF